jgi:L-malate glycosyltransferase
MKRLLFVISSLRREGPVIQLLTLIRQLPAHRFRVSVLSLSAPVANGIGGAGLMVNSIGGARDSANRYSRPCAAQQSIRVGGARDSANRYSNGSDGDSALGMKAEPGGEITEELFDNPAGNLENEFRAASVATQELFDSPAGDLENEFRAAGAAVYFESLRGWRYMLGSRSRFRAIVEHIEPDIIQCSGIRADLLGAWFSTQRDVNICVDGYPNMRIYTVMHNIPWEDYNFTYGRFTSWIMTRLQRRAWSRMDAVIGVSEFVKTEVLRRWPELPMRSIPNGVDFSEFDPVVSTKTDHEITSVTLLCTDHLSPLKDPLTLIRAFQLLRSRHQSISLKLIFAGDGPLREACAQEAANQSGVYFTGRTNRVASLYKQADIVVSASRSEGFHLSVAEGIGCGLVPVLSNIGVRREFYRGFESLVKPLLFSVGDVEAASLSLSRAVGLVLLKRGGRAHDYLEHGAGDLVSEQNAFQAIGSFLDGNYAGDLVHVLNAFQADFRLRFSDDRMASDYIRLYNETRHGGVDRYSGESSESGVPVELGESSESGVPEEVGESDESGVPGEQGESSESGVPGEQGESSESGVPEEVGESDEAGVPGEQVMPDESDAKSSVTTSRLASKSTSDDI